MRSSVDTLYDQLYDVPDKLGSTSLMERASLNGKMDAKEKESEEIIVACMVIHFDIIPNTKLPLIKKYIEESKFDKLYIKESYTQYILGGGRFSTNTFRTQLIKYVESLGSVIPKAIKTIK